jgi:hypothetical protein
MSLLSHGSAAPSGPWPQYRGFTIALRHTTICRTPLLEGSAPLRNLYLTTHKNYKRQTCLDPAGFEPAIPVREQPQTHALDRAATYIDSEFLKWKILQMFAITHSKIVISIICIKLQMDKLIKNEGPVLQEWYCLLGWGEPTGPHYKSQLKLRHHR